MPEPTQDAVRERVVVAVQRLRAIGAMFPEANADADAIDALLALRPTEPTPEQGRVECKWWQDERPDDSLWYSGCGQEWIFNAFGPVENGCKFCHHCGGPVVITERTERIDLGDGV